jgi:hypothetical protein
MKSKHNTNFPFVRGTSVRPFCKQLHWRSVPAGGLSRDLDGRTAIKRRIQSSLHRARWTPSILPVDNRSTSTDAHAHVQRPTVSMRRRSFRSLGDERGVIDALRGLLQQVSRAMAMQVANWLHPPPPCSRPALPFTTEVFIYGSSSDPTALVYDGVTFSVSTVGYPR